MSTPGRPTLRCLQKLAMLDGWTDANHQRMVLNGSIELPLSRLGHPIIQKVAKCFPPWGTQIHKYERIKGLHDPPWWKARREQRWRGAVWEDPESGQAWLCDAGIRRAKEDTDFYATFVNKVQAEGAAAFLPSAEDQELLRCELTTETLDRWEREVCRTAVIAALTAVDRGAASVEIAGPQGEFLSEVLMSADVFDDNRSDRTLVELVIELNWKDWSRIDAQGWLASLIQTAINPMEQDWRSHPVNGRPNFSIVMQLGALDAAPSRVDSLVSGQMGVAIAGGFAHRVPKTDLIDSMVEGRATRALCGVWFVPRQDWQSKDLCPSCDQIYLNLAG